MPDNEKHGMKIHLQECYQMGVMSSEWQQLKDAAEKIKQSSAKLPMRGPAVILQMEAVIEPQ